MNLDGIYYSFVNFDPQNLCFENYKIKIRVKETPKTYVFELLEFYAPFGDAPQMAAFFGDKKKKVVKKNSGEHRIDKWDDGDFTFYPYRAGVPFWFRKCED